MQTEHGFLRMLCRLLLVCGVLSCAGCYQSGYNEGYRDGRVAGRESGLKEGKESGLKEGTESGYAQGWRKGWTTGYGQGSVAFMGSRWLPSLAAATLSAGGLIVLFLIAYLFALLVFPAVSWAIGGVRRRVRAKWSWWDERRRRRQHLLRLQAEKVFRVKLLAAQLAEKAQAAIQEEETLDRFEQALQTMRETVSEEHWQQLKALGARWAEVAAAIDSHLHLAPEDKETFRREMITAYQQSTTSPPPTA